MTDQQLLDLCAQTPQEDLSREQLQALRERLTSAEFRRRFIDELGMGDYVADALRRLQTSLAEIPLAPPIKPVSKKSSPLKAALYVVGWLAAAFGGALAVNALRPTAQVVEAPLQPREEKPSEQPASPLEETQPAEPMPEAQPPADSPNPAPPKEPTPPPPAEETPWQAVVAKQPPLPSFREVAFADFAYDKFLPRTEELKRWFDRTPFELSRVDTDTRFGKCGQLKGLAKLKAPWLPDSVLRLSLENYNLLKFHFFRGDQGVTLAYYEPEARRWFAYATTRKPGGVRPESYALTASDMLRNQRTGISHGGPFELRCTGKEIILSRGDIVLLRAGFEGTPDDVYFDGSAVFYGIQFARTADPPPAERVSPLAVDIERPADHEWTSRLPKVLEPQKLDNGSVRLATKDAIPQRVEAYMPLPRQRLQEVILQVENITPGAGVYLGRQQGAPYEVIRFHKNPRSSDLIAAPRHWDDVADGEGRLPAEQPTAAVAGKRAWVRLIYGVGMVAWQLSSDGEHWGQFDFGVDWTPGEVTSVGLQVVANRPDCGITLRRVQLRDLTGFAGLVDPALVERAIPAEKAETLGSWLAAIAAEQPTDVAAEDWRRACAVKRLGLGARRALAGPLVDRLLDDAFERRVPPEQYFAAVDEFGRLCTTLSDNTVCATGVMRRYLNAATRGDVPFHEAWRRWMSAPLAAPWYDYNLPLETFVRGELVGTLQSKSPEEALAVARRLRFYKLDEQNPLVRWADYRARRELPGRTVTGDPMSRQVKEGWTHPLIEDLNKEAYNVASELRAVFDGENPHDAAKHIARLNPGDVPGLAPSGTDPQLSASAVVAVRAALAAHPQVEQILSNEYQQLAKLRFAEAAASGDLESIRLTTLLFPGTEAGAEAHRWLGDRALVSGWFESAVAEYQRAIADGSSSLARETEPRLRLAAAMTGRDLGSPATAAVSLGDHDLSASDFEALVKELRERKDPAAVIARGFSAAESRGAVPNPTAYQPHARGRLDGPLGERPNEEGARHVNHLKAPWVDRQLAAAVVADTLYVSNRFQLSAFRLSDGGRQWQSAPQGLKNRRSQDFALIAMRPLVFADRLVARMVYGDGLTLVAMDRADGKIRWTNPLKEPETLVSDPFTVRGRLIAITALRDAQEVRLRWTTFDADTGSVEEQRDLVRLQPLWLDRPCCEFTVTPDGVLLNLAGAVVATDHGGAVRWVRRTLVTPQEEDTRWVLQEYQPPVVSGDRVLIAQPGMRSVDCLDVATGARVWSAVLPEVNGIVGLSGDRVIVKEEKSLLALSAGSGSVLWRRPLGEVHPTFLCDDSRILSLEREKIEANKERRRNQLFWRDAATGAVVATSPLVDQDGDDPRLGLLLPHGDRLWLFAGKTQTEPDRTLLELVPSGVATPARSREPSLWQRGVPEKILDLAAERFPDWELLSTHVGDQTGVVPEIFGEKDVLGLRVNNEKSICWMRTLEITADKSKLKLRIGADDDFPWRLKVHANGKTLENIDVRKDKVPGDWHDWEVNLGDFTGQKVLLIVEAIGQDGKDFATFWKRLELAP